MKQNDGSGKGARPMSAGNTGLETQDEPQEVLNMCRRILLRFGMMRVLGMC